MDYKAVYNEWLNDPALGEEGKRELESVKGEKRFGPLFSTYLVTVIAIMCVNVLCAFATFGAALLVTVPVSYLIMLFVQFVGYYTFEKKKYFLTEDTVIRPKEEKTNDNYYDDFDEV